MLKTMIEKIEKVLKGKISKTKFQEKIAKHPAYLVKAKEIWNMINNDLGISDTVENKFLPKIEKFEKMILAKFPELTKEDVLELRKSISGEFNVGKEKVLNQIENLKQMQIFNNKLKEENEKLKAELDKLKINDPLITEKVVENPKIEENEKLNEDNK
jgi:hypothetical protein